MNYADLVSDLPADRLSFSCVEQNEEVLKRFGVTQEERQLGKGRFQSDLATAQINEVQLYSDRFNTALSLYCQPPPNSVAMLFTRSPEHEFHANGVDVTRGGFAFIPSERGPDIVAKGLFGSDSIVIAEDRFDGLFETLCPDVGIPDIVTVLAANTPKTERLQAEIVKLINDPLSNPERAISLTEATITFLGESLRRRRLKPLNAMGRRRIAKRAQAFIEEHYADPIHIEDLCRATGVGVRSLQRAFRGYFDVTLTEYTKTVRLDMAYRVLTGAQPGECSITEVALEHGFGHLGRFSVMYGARFGESPSATLAATPVIGQVS